jgi:predicted RNA binding protein YcfA (HicA-like mRNA interferase family)
MSDLIENVVSFLADEEALRFSESPWPTVPPEEQATPIDWHTGFPPRSRRPPMDGEPLVEAVAQAMVTEGGFEDDAILNPHWNSDNDPWHVDLPEDLIGAIREAIENPERYREPERGLRVDVCAWYQPIHFFGHDWGIYSREDCLKAMAVQIAAYVSRRPGAIAAPVQASLAKACLRGALGLYFLHEQYHHKTECFGIRNHVVLSRQVYVPYFSAVYLKLKGTDDHLEEALPNADIWHRLGTRPYSFWLGATVLKATRDLLKATFPHEPPGYRKAVDHLEKAAFDTAENLLQGQIHGSSPNPKLAVSRWDIAPRMLQSFLPITSDIYTVVPAGTTSVLGAAVTPAKTCSTRELVSLLKLQGWIEVDGGKGSHVKLKKPNAPTIILPGNRKDLSPGVMKYVLRILGGYSLSDLPALLSAN